MHPAATEDSSPGAGSGGGIWLTITKLLSILRVIFDTFILKYIVSPNQAPPPPILPISSPVPSPEQPNINDLQLHPITRIMREQELGKATITLAVTMAAAVLISGNGTTKLMVANVVAVGLMTGSMAVWNGILFRTSFPRIANVLEQVGISLVLLSLYGLFASFLPKGFSWILWLSGALCLVPFSLARFHSTRNS